MLWHSGGGDDDDDTKDVRVRATETVLNDIVHNNSCSRRRHNNQMEKI